MYMFTYMKLKGLKILEFSNGDQCESKIKTAFLQVSDLVMCLLFVHTIYMRDFAPVCVCVGDHRILRHNLRCISQQQVFVAE